ncbi:MAG: NAD(P)/FAD-dependent oxidoreductase [Acidimicrobiales bacterium]
MTEVVIVGAGFGGLSTARALVRQPDASAARITVVDRHVYSTFQPLLYQVATGGLNPGDVAYPIRGFAERHRVRYRHGQVVGVDPGSRSVRLADGTSVPFDYLVVAVGTTANYFGVPGAAEHSVALYTRATSIGLRDALMGMLEHFAEHDRGSASVVVVGGGPTGVEMAGALAELRSALRRTFPEGGSSALRVVLVERAPDLLSPFARSLRAYATRELERRGVEVRVGTGISEVGPDFVRLADGSTLPANLTVWAAGVVVDPSVTAWGLPQESGGRIRVGADLRVEGHERIFAVGDAAVGAAEPLAQLAQPALQTGRHAGVQIARLIAGAPTEPFVYRDKGMMATVGRRAALVQLPSGLQVTGTFAWLAWLALHLVMLLGGRNRASALLNLSARYALWPRSLIVGDIREAE